MDYTSIESHHPIFQINIQQLLATRHYLDCELSLILRLKTIINQRLLIYQWMVRFTIIAAVRNSMVTEGLECPSGPDCKAILSTCCSLGCEIFWPAFT